ncbi:MAG: bifunctional diaminohydroxyphosphoribosylaminopyrimidine deaminase/5-amino-6-(5-phosphoribosylamino)uracil reductase RibD [Acidobacteria bacterium]|nr:MAG: bifunctional diaminohydroxyphosphoribosylaminopyrimidine deaminase/5-amino-6-(5-phosphoribosylamino)uracil reductase RibD [Acidobacteriota bacterium]
MIDDAMMDEALALAARGRGATSPNPMVGAILTRGDRVVGRGFHARAGGPHAEVVALDEAGGAADGATLYCTLEPCCHTGRTGPCVERIVRAGVRDVVVGVEDPDPRVSGAGIRYLHDQGITVTVGVRRRAATRLNEAFFTVKRRARPFVTMKAAVSLDGRIAAAPGRRTSMSGAAALGHAHAVRAEVDAIAVGSETVLVDDPLLTARGVARRRPLVRVLFDTRMRTPPSARVLTTCEEGPVVVITTEAAVDAWPMRAAALERAGAVIEALPARDPAAAMSRLVAYEVSDVLLEGGAVLQQAAWTAGVIDRVRLYVVPVVLGRTGVPWMRHGRFSFAALADCRTQCLGQDVLLEADVQRFD